MDKRYIVGIYCPGCSGGAGHSLVAHALEPTWHNRLGGFGERLRQDGIGIGVRPGRDLGRAWELCTSLGQ